MTNSNVTDRELSCFFVRELLPLYLENNLDAIRTEQISIHLKTCEVCQAHFTKTKRARQILEELSHTQAQSSLVEYLKKEHHFWIDFFERAGWQRWPSTLKWAVELSGVALALVVVIHWFPWLNFAKQVRSMRAAQVAAINKPATQAQTVTTVASDDVSTQGDDEPQPFKSSVTKAGPKSLNAVASDETTGGDEGEDEVIDKGKSLNVAPAKLKPKPTQVATSQNDDQDEAKAKAKDKTGDPDDSPSASDVAATTAAEEGAGSDTKAEEGDNKKVGYVWRGTLKVEELTDDLAEKVTRVVTELGGVKAGQVELGWHRGGQRYYHFVLPEENYEKLLSALNGEGILTLNREVHPRVIKEGHMRIIMTLEEDQ